jgi:uncharacterized protein YutD
MIKQPKPFEGYNLEELKTFLNDVLEKVNSKILDLNKNKIDIKGYNLIQEVHTTNHKGIYRASERMIELRLDLGITPKEILKTFLHELAHAYQHQIIPSYYQDILRNTTNESCHDETFKTILNKFEEIINDVL